jgi:hypothetical protein
MSKQDDRIEADVHLALTNDPHGPYAGEIAVESYDGFVTLRGTVAAFWQERAAVADTLRTLGEKTLGSIIELFEEKSFALLFILLLEVSALPLPTGGATRLFEIVAMLLALELIAGRDQIWLPERWRRLRLAGPSQQRFLNRLMKTVRWLERFSRARELPVRAPAQQHRVRRARLGGVSRGVSRPAVLWP